MQYYIYISQYYTIENSAYISHDKYMEYFKKRVRRDWRKNKTKKNKN